MFIELTTIDIGPVLINLHHLITVADADSVGGGCFIVTTNDMKYGA